MKEFIEKAKAAGGKMNWTSPGAGTTPQLAGELLKIRTGIEMLRQRETINNLLVRTSLQK